MNWAHITLLGSALTEGTPAGEVLAQAAAVDINLWMVCLNAFAAVIGLLSLLAIGMRLLTWLLPQAPAPAEVIVRADDADAALVGSIVAAAAAAVPGSRVTHIQEINR